MVHGTCANSGVAPGPVRRYCTVEIGPNMTFSHSLKARKNSARNGGLQPIRSARSVNSVR